MFDSNAMAELGHLSRARYDRNGGGGAFKVYNTSKAYYEAIGHKELPPWQRLVIETKQRWEASKTIACEQFRIACLTSHDGFYHGSRRDGQIDMPVPQSLNTSKPMRGRKPQRPCDIGLFSDEADQLDLVEMFQDEE